MLTAARIAAALEAGRKTGLGYIPWVYPAPAYAPWTTPAAPYTPQVAQPTCPPGYSMKGGECVLNQSAWQKFAQTVNQLNTSGNVVPAIPPSAAAALQAAISNVLNMLRTSGAPNCMSGSNPVVLSFQQAYNAFSPSKIQASGCYDTATQAALGQVGVNNPPPPMSGVPQPTNQAPLVLMPENFESDTAGRGAEQKPVPVPPTYSSSEGTVPVAHQFRPSDQGYPPSPAAPSTVLSEPFHPPSPSTFAPGEYRGPLAGLPDSSGSPGEKKMLTIAGIADAIESGRKAGLGSVLTTASLLNDSPLALIPPPPPYAYPYPSASEMARDSAQYYANFYTQYGLTNDAVLALMAGAITAQTIQPVLPVPSSWSQTATGAEILQQAKLLIAQGFSVPNADGSCPSGATLINGVCSKSGEAPVFTVVGTNTPAWITPEYTAEPPILGPRPHRTTQESLVRIVPAHPAAVEQGRSRPPPPTGQNPPVAQSVRVPAPSSFSPGEYRGPLAGLPHTKGSPMLTTAGISTALEAGRKAGLGAAARPAAPAITDVHWKALPGPLFAKLWAQPTFRNAYNAGTVTNNVFGAGSQWMTFRYGNVWYSRVLAAGPGQGYRYFIYVPAQLRGLGAAAPNPQLAPAGVGQALLSAASSLDDLLSASGAPPYTSGTGTNSGPSNPTVLAFQQAWNQDSAVSATQLLEDGRYGSQTYAAINSLGYSEPSPIVTYGGSGTIIQPGGSQTAGISTSDANNQSVTIFGVPTWIIIAAAAVGGVAIVGTAVASQHGQAIKSQMTKTTQTVRRHAARLHPRHLMHA